MPFIPTPNTARCAIRYALFGQDVINTLWFRKTGLGPIDPLDLANLALDLGSWATTNLTPILSNDLQIQSVTCTSQDSLISPSVEQPITPGIGALGPSLPGNVCLTVKFNTAFRGRSGRGRNYVSGIREADVVGNVVDETFGENLVTAYNLLVSTPPTDWNFVLVSHFSDNAPRTEGLIMDILSTSIVDPNVDSQRRRLSGRGS